MARRDLTGLLQLLEAYRQFSPEQKLKQDLMQSQIDASGQGLKESQYNLDYRAKADPLNLDMLGQQIQGAKNENTFNQKALPLKLGALEQGNKLTAEQILGASLNNTHASNMNPLEVTLRREMNPIQIGTAKAQLQDAQNNNSMFPTRQKLADLNVKEAAQQLQMNPVEAASMQKARAIQSYALLKQLQFNPQGTGQEDITNQEMLSALLGEQAAPALTPNIDLFGNMPTVDRNTLSQIMQGVQNNPEIINRIFARYPEAAMRLIPNKRPQ